MQDSKKHYAVPDIRLARLPGQFKLSVTPDRQFVEHEVAGWSVGLHWLTFGFGNLPHEPQSPLFVAKRDDEYLTAFEKQSFDDWMQPYYPRHLEMHELAVSLGLEPGVNDLPIERILIDRLLKDLLTLEGVDLHGPAATMAGNDDYLQFLANCMDYMQTFVGKRRFQLTQLGSCVPELSAELRIGEDAIYNGFALDVKVQLPNVILDSLAGHRLGDVVSTRLTDLDQRTITGIVTDRDETHDHRLPESWARLQLSPELVPLGKRTG